MNRKLWQDDKHLIYLFVGEALDDLESNNYLKALDALDWLMEGGRSFKLWLDMDLVKVTLAYLGVDKHD